MRVLNDEVKKGRIFIDCGNCVGWSLNYLVVDPPVTFHKRAGYGTDGLCGRRSDRREAGAAG